MLKTWEFVGDIKVIKMSKNYKMIIKNLKEYIEEKHSFKIINKNFDIDDGQFSKLKAKNEYEKDKEKSSIDWLQNMEIYYSENVFLDEKIIFGRYFEGDYEERKGVYIILSTSNLSSFNNIWIKEIAREVEMNLGIFLSLFNKTKNAPLINKLITDIKVEDILDIEYSEYEQNHDYNEIIKLFAPMYCFKINEEYLSLDENSTYKIENIEQFKYRFLGIIKSNDKLSNINREEYFSELCIKEYLSAFEQDIIEFPYENLYLSLCHNSPKFIFLEIYRMIEKLYPIIFYYNFRKGFGLNNITTLEMQDKMQGKLKIRHREKDAIFHIFEYCKENKKIEEYLNKLNQYKTEIDIDNKTTELDKWIYKIRNTSVHLSFDKKKDVDILSILEKDIIVANLIPIVVELYISILN